MGAYLAKPKTEKISESNENGKVSYGMSCMQGWRVTMEDAHTCLLDFDNSATLFAVYDGHGGSEVAKYVAKHLPEVLKDTETYKKGEFKQSMVDSFLEVDQLIISDEGLAELKELAGLDKEADEGEDLGLLEQEATMPLHELLAKMKEMKKKLGEDEENVEYWTENNEQTTADDDEKKSNKQTTAGDREKNSKDKEPSQSANTPKENGTKNGKEEKVNENDSENGEGSSLADVNVTNDEKANDDKEKNEESDHSDNKQDEKPLREEAGPSQTGKVDENNKGDEKISDPEGDEDEEEDDESEDDDDDDDDDDDEDDEDGDEDDNGEQDGIPNAGFQSSDEVGYDSGTTAIVALVHGNQLTVGNVGDSRCVLCRNGIALEMSIDHKPEDEPELNRIHKAGGKVTCEGRVNGGLNLSRALGDHSYKLQTELSAHEQQITAVPDVRQTQLTEADEFMVIACDGIWNVKGSQEVVDFVADRLREQKKNNQLNLTKICEELLDSCLAPDTTGDGSGCDNMTSIVVLFNSESGSATDNNSKKRKQQETDLPDGDSADKRIKTDDF